MKLNIKTLQKKVFSVEVDSESTTVFNIKEAIESKEESGNLPIERQKLIFSGKILDDSLTLIESSLKENDFIILMALNITKKSLPPVTKIEETKTTSPTSAKSTSLSKEKEEGSFTSSISSQLLTGEDYDACVARLVDMGFLKENVIHALRASFNNPERAVEYLTSGSIPNETYSEQKRFRVEGTESFKAICSTPQFRQLISILRQNPEQLPSIVEQLTETTPEFVKVIEENKEEFLSLLHEDSNYLDSFDGSDSEGDFDLSGAGDENEDVTSAGREEEEEIIQITTEENESIERLINLGFQRNQVIEAFIACDKNEELAANFLFDNNL